MRPRRAPEALARLGPGGFRLESEPGRRPLHGRAALRQRAADVGATLGKRKDLGDELPEAVRIDTRRRERDERQDDTALARDFGEAAGQSGQIGAQSSESGAMAKAPAFICFSAQARPPPMNIA